jgi:hypothetical protein
MKRITVVAEDRAGLLADVAKILADNDINIEYVEAEEHKHIGVMLLEVSDYDNALKVLKDAGYCAISEEALILKLEDKPGALAQIALRFKEAGINMRSIRFIKREDNYGIVAVSVERTKEAMKLVEDVLVS